jgi:hypothetical protein
MGLTKDLGALPRAITVDSNNNVGVGTSPAQKFQINGALALSNLAEDFTTNQQFAYPIIYSSNLSGLGNGELVIQPRTTATRSIRFVTRGAGAVSSTNPDTRMMIKWDGNIGIGTTNPLTISNYRIVTTNDVSGSGYAAQTNGVLSLYSYSNANGSTISEQRSLPLFFETNGTERMRIFSSGNVFIGPSPSDAGFRLDVNGTSIIRGVATFGNSINVIDNSVLNLGSNQGGGATLRYNPNGNLDITPRDGYDTAFTRGNVLMGSTSSVSTRQEFRMGGNSGGSRISMGLNGTNYSALVTDSGGNVYIVNEYNDASIVLAMINYNNGVYLAKGATAWTSYSDERLKNINGNIENAVDKLMTLRTVNFSWKDDENQKENLGLIAQDVEKVFPQVIDSNTLTNLDESDDFDKTEYLGVRYQELVPVLIKAIQELTARLEILENK